MLDTKAPSLAICNLILCVHSPRSTRGASETSADVAHSFSAHLCNYKGQKHVFIFNEIGDYSPLQILEAT